MGESTALVTRGAGMLRTPRLVLRPLSPTDAKNFFPILKDPAIYRFIPEDPPASMDALRKQFERFVRGPAPDLLEVWMNWGVFFDDEPIGRVQSTIRVPARMGEIAYVFGMAHRKQGLASEAVFTMCEWLFKHWFEVATATIDSRNLDSMALVTRLGFHEVSRVANAEFFKGTPSHEVIFACRSQDLCRPRPLL